MVDTWFAQALETLEYSEIKIALLKNMKTLDFCNLLKKIFELTCSCLRTLVDISLLYNDAMFVNQV